MQRGKDLVLNGWRKGAKNVLRQRHHRLPVRFHEKMLYSLSERTGQPNG